MNIVRIATPLSGEHLLAVTPRPAPFVDAHWRRRLNLFAGRTLSDTALRAEQQSRAGRIATFAQTRSPGIVQGLEASLEGTGSDAFINVTAGSGLAISGEDVQLPRALRVKLSDLLPAPPAAELRAGILLLAPVELLAFGRANSQDPCEVDEAEIAFADEQWLDGAELRLLPWDAAWSEGEALSATTAGRNALANRIFSDERRHMPSDHHPWERSGVPLALLGLDGTAAVYLDRFAVARSGGLPRARTPLVAVPAALVGTPGLWQARFQQFLDHVADLQQAGTAIESMKNEFGLLPPVGLLPSAALTFQLTTTRPSTRRPLAAKNSFFPANFLLWVAPVPIEQLDGVLERSASLAPLASDAPERVLVLAPVPQAVYEPDLLIDEAVDPAFQATLDQLTAARDDRLGREAYLRDVIRILTTSTDGREAVPQYPALDPDEPQVNQLSDGEDTYGVVVLPQIPGATTQPVRAPELIVELHQFLGGLSVLSESELQNGRTGLNDVGLAAFVQILDSKLDKANDVIDFAFLKAHSDIYRLRQLMLGNSVGSRLAASPALASIAFGESAAAVRTDINNFYVALKGALPFEKPVEPLASPSITGAASGTVGGASPERLAAPTLSSSFALTADVAATSFAVQARALAPTHAVGAGALIGGQLLGARSSSVKSDAVLSSAGAAITETAFVSAPPTRTQVQDASPVIGDGAYDFRTTSILKRLDDSVAREAKGHAVSNRFELVSLLIRLLTEEKLNINEIPVQGVPLRDTPRLDAQNKPVLDPNTGKPIVDPTYDAEGLPVRVAVPLGQLMDAATLPLLLDDPAPKIQSEATYFAEALRVVEGTIATLRAVEGQVANYKSVLDRCSATLADVRSAIAAAVSRLGVVDGDLDRARHGIVTVKALLVDETTRVEAINARRHAVVSEHLQFLAYARPRTADAVLDVPGLLLNPGQVEAAVPACLVTHGAPPPELDRMIQLLREAPVAWFVNLPSVVDRLDRVALLQGTLLSAQLRARTLLAAFDAAPGNGLTFIKTTSQAPLALSVGRATEAQQSVIQAHRLELARLDLSGLTSLGWRDTRERVIRVVSLGDLIEANHGRVPVARAAAQELEQISEIAGCLHAQISDIPPVIRLLWAERLSQYEQAAPLGNLSALPRWAAVDPQSGEPEIRYADRKRIQSLVDWLYGRIDSGNAEAVAWMHDLVRVCILLASHAPVDEIISGRVPVASSISPGGSLPVEIDPTRVKVGMRVLFFDGAQLQAHGLVEDIVGQRALARVIETNTPSVALAANAKARFVEANGRFTPSFFRR